MNQKHLAASDFLFQNKKKKSYLNSMIQSLISYSLPFDEHHIFYAQQYQGFSYVNEYD